MVLKKTHEPFDSRFNQTYVRLGLKQGTHYCKAMVELEESCEYFTRVFYEKRQ